MTVAQLRSNLAKAKQAIEEVLLLSAQREQATTDEERLFFDKAGAALLDQIAILNSAIPSLVDAIKIEKAELVARPAVRPVPRVPRIPRVAVKPAIRPGVRIPTVGGVVTISKADKRHFLEDAKIEARALKELRKKLAAKPKPKPLIEAYKSTGPFVRTASRIFAGLSTKLAKADIFASLNKDLRKAGMPYLLNSYISFILLSTLIALLIAAGNVLVLNLLGIGTLITNTAIALVLPLLVFIIGYALPATKAAGIKTKINDELPFATMHMTAIASSGVEPSKVFRVIATSAEYPNISKEARKIVNQLNFYGYDLSTALKETAKTTSSPKLAELLNGMATTIATGGNLQEYLNKSASDSLTDYRLKRKRYTTASGTYADVYTGLLIAAPLILMLILTLINVIGISIAGLSAETIVVVGIAAIAILNIGFLVFLKISQPAA